MSPPRPRVRLDSVNRPFWTGGAEGKLNITRCGDCGEFTHPPQVLCRHCRSENVAPHAVSGRAEVDTYTINYQAWAPGLEVPLVIARVKLEDAPGVYLTRQFPGRCRRFRRQGARRVRRAGRRVLPPVREGRLT